MSLKLPPILIVDDEKNMRLSLKTILEDEKYTVLTADSAEQAWTILHGEEVLLVITDARLGGMSGYDLLTEIKKKWPEIPVLVITAYATPKLAVDVIKAGALDYLAKPFAPEELLHAISRCVERFKLLR